MTRAEKMSVCGDEEERSESSVSGCVSMKGDKSLILPPHFSNEPEPDDGG